jgi:hypothetical protein
VTNKLPVAVVFASGAARLTVAADDLILTVFVKGPAKFTCCTWPRPLDMATVTVLLDPAVTPLQHSVPDSDPQACRRVAPKISDICHARLTAPWWSVTSELLKPRVSFTYTCCDHTGTRDRPWDPGTWSAAPASQ